MLAAIRARRTVPEASLGDEQDAAAEEADDDPRLVGHRLLAAARVIAEEAAVPEAPVLIAARPKFQHFLAAACDPPAVDLLGILIFIGLDMIDARRRKLVELEEKEA